MEDYESVLPDRSSEKSVHTPTGSVHSFAPLPPEKHDITGEMNGSALDLAAEKPLPATPKSAKMTLPASRTPPLRKKVPWKGGKTIMISLPRDQERGKRGEAPRPLTAKETTGMFRSWEELGYDIRGFDLSGVYDESVQLENSQSRGTWPNFDDLDKERADRQFKVTLPDLHAWKSYVDELNEAKLRALGVSFGDDEPAPSISPASTMSRQASVTHYPPLPFSPPLPTSSASSSHGQFQFTQLVPGALSSATQSPAVPSVASPASFAAKFNPRASISLPSPHAWSPQMLLQQGLARGGSPAVANITSLVSPTSPFQQDPMLDALAHQRHQSVQYSLLPHQLQQAARASPGLQQLPEVEEEAQSKSPSKTPEPPHGPMIRHNASASLQKEIDEAEYHLEEQMRSQLDRDEDYSPDADVKKVDAAAEASQPDSSHVREPSVQFATQPPLPKSDDGPVLHHPQPHSRGHSLSQRYFSEQDDAREAMNEAPAEKHESSELDKADDAHEIRTNPSSLGTPVQGQDFVENVLHGRTFSTASNPSADLGFQPSAGSVGSRRSSHGSKPSLSKLNVAAPEFKFNPAMASTFNPVTAGTFHPATAGTFQPSQFTFSGNTFQPVVFQSGFSGNAPVSSNPSQFSVPASVFSKINVNAPEFSPGQSDFSFSTTGPRFRPDAPAFNPGHSISESSTGPLSASESAGNRANSIFGNIDLNIPDAAKPGKKSKAIPIVRPDSRTSPQPDDELRDGPDGRLTDMSHRKKQKGRGDGGDEIALFAEPTPEPEPVEAAQDLATQALDESLGMIDDGSRETQDDDDHTAPADTTFSSTMVSETTDTKDSPLQSSPEQRTLTWAPHEFKNQAELQSFNDARPFGEDHFKKHRKSLSAAATPFIPGIPGWNDASADEVAEVGDDDFAERDTESAAKADGVEPIQARDNTVIAQVAVGEPATRPVEADDSQPSALTSPTAFVFPPSPKGLSGSRFAAEPRKPSGLLASRFASNPPPPKEEDKSDAAQPLGIHDREPEPEEVPAESPETHSGLGEEPTFEEIDAVMRHLDEYPNMGVKKTVPSPRWHQPSPTRPISIAAVTNTSPLHLLPQEQFDGGVAEQQQPTKDRYLTPPVEGHKPMQSTELEDPFVDPPQNNNRALDNAAGHFSPSEPSDWEGAFSDEEQAKLDSRANFFDGHVNHLFGDVLNARLGPLEQTLEGLQHALAALTRQTPPSRRDRRSMSAEIQESDADDEDDEAPPRRSVSPRKDRRMEQIRVAVLEALASQQASRALQAPVAAPESQSQPLDTAPIMQALEEMKEQFGQSMHLDFRGEDLRNIVEDAVERRMPATPKPAQEGDLESRLSELQTTVADLERRLHLEQSKSETEMSGRRAAEDKAAETQRRLDMAETRVEIEIMNKSAFDQRVADLEDKLKHQEERTEEEVEQRRMAEDRLSEVQRLLRISSEEETRLREALDETEQKVKSVEQARGDDTMRLSLLEAAQTTGSKTQSDLLNRLNIADVDLHDARQEAQHWKGEAGRLGQVHGRHTDDLAQALDENKRLQRLVDTIGTQLRETERVREGWRAKFQSLQNDMAQAAREIAEENARRTKKEQAQAARHEVLDARLQAEARTRERLETEIERLEGGERQGLRAVAETKRLEGLLGELRTENHKLQQTAMRYQAEFQEARESAAREVQRTRESMQSEVEDANNQVNVVREELEDHVGRLQAHLDQVKVDAETVRARHDMLLEESESNKRREVEALVQKHQNEMEDVQARYERRLNNTTEDAQRSEQNLLERLSISTSKCELLQGRIANLEEKVEIAQEAARAAAQAAKTAPATAEQQQPQQPAHPRAVAKSMELPEKISPQALRESIMVLQEQLQERELRIEDLEQQLAKTDPDAPTKIAKRDDEIIWLRELLAVRRSDLEDIIAALGADQFDRDAVQDAAIRLKANLQMEEQERERAMNGGSAISLPSMAATLRDAATPRVAQAVGPLAAAWGNWRKSQGISSVLSSPATTLNTARATPARARNVNPTSAAAVGPSPASLLSGLMTPPASGLRRSPSGTGASSDPASAQPAAFSSSARRYTGQQAAAPSSRQAEKMPVRAGPAAPPFGRQHSRSAAGEAPVTPPMMRPSAYDSDAHAADFDDAGLFDDD